MKMTNEERGFLESVNSCLNLTLKALVLSFNDEQSRLYMRMNIYLEIKSYCEQGQFGTAAALFHGYEDILRPDDRKAKEAEVNTNSPSTGQ
jgi:hypothetical protein